MCRLIPNVLSRSRQVGSKWSSEFTPCGRDDSRMSTLIGPSLVINEGSCVETRAQTDHLDPEHCSLTKKILPETFFNSNKRQTLPVVAQQRDCDTRDSFNLWLMFCSTKTVKSVLFYTFALKES